MPDPTNLLNDDGTASMATALLMSHHGLRRDLRLLGRALEAVAGGDKSRVEALREEWKNYHNTLHGHHEAEDRGLFPNLRAQRAELSRTIDLLGADHRRIDPLLERGDAAFSSLPHTEVAIAVVRELEALLTPHLATEEAELIPLLREAKAFPPPPTEADAALYAKGFAWSMHGVAPEVLEQVYEMLPEVLVAKLPEARAEFAARFERAWGNAKVGATRTSFPDV